MPLVRWDPFAELNNLQDQMSGLMGQAFGPHSLAPVTDVYNEDDKHLVAEVHLPNFNENEVHVDVHDKVLTISAEHTEKEEKERKYLVRESSTSFYRQISLPRQADEDAISASFTKGVLKVTVPFKELPKPKKIAISATSSEKKSSKK